MVDLKNKLAMNWVEAVTPTSSSLEIRLARQVQELNFVINICSLQCQWGPCTGDIVTRKRGNSFQEYNFIPLVMLIIWEFHHPAAF